MEMKSNTEVQKNIKKKYECTCFTCSRYFFSENHSAKVCNNNIRFQVQLFVKNQIKKLHIDFLKAESWNIK